jgi:nucleotide-binding universal stress UspA family protein
LENVEDELAQFIDIVKNFKATLELVYIYPVFPPNIDIATFDNDNFLYELTKRFDYDKINLHFVHTNGDNEVAEGMNLFVAAYKPSLLVMHTHHRDLFSKFFNSSITEEISMKTKLPLLAFKTK